jgi:hypothetical protein
MRERATILSIEVFLSSERIRAWASGWAKGSFIPALPAMAVVVVAYGLVVGGRSRPVVGARVRGGPTEGASAVSFRVEVVERDGEDEHALGGRDATIEVRPAQAGGKVFSRFLDSDGSATVALGSPRPLSGPVHLTVCLNGTDGRSEPVLDEVVSATAEAWARAARRRGEWVDGRTEKGLVVRASAERGVFAVPFQDALRVEVRRHGVPTGGIVVTAASETSDVEPASTVTDPSGRARLLVRPREHAASVTLRASAPDGVGVSLDMALAVVPGALHASLGDEGIVVQSPIARTRAYVAVVGEHERFTGGPVTLASDGHGNVRGVLPIAGLPADGPLWAVVSSEPDLHSAALVGWPIRPRQVPGALSAQSEEPARTFDVPDLLLADGVAKAMARERVRVRSARLSAAAFASGALALTVLLVTRRARRAASNLAEHLASAGADALSTRQMAGSGGDGPWFVLVAALCLGLAAALIGVFVLFR